MKTTPPDIVGKTLGGRYEVLRALGAEGLGHNFAARDLNQDGQLFAVKAISADVGGDEETFARFGREISASLMVAHPNTVEVLDYGQEGEIRYLVSEYLVAHPLSQELAKGPLAVERVAVLAAQVAQAIGAAHHEDIVHRALSPDNVLVLENSRDGDFVKVRDFGLAKMADAQGENELTQTGVRLGEPAYMAPEYIQTGTFGPKADVYALGCLMFELVAGRPPYQGDRSSVLQAQVTQPAPRLSAVVPSVPAWFDALVGDLMAKEPDARPGIRAVAQRVEDGLGRPLDLPDLWPLDVEGNIQRAEEASDGMASARIAVLVAVVALGGLSLVGVLLAALAAIVFVLTSGS